jgi:hypothetical protein
MAWCRIQKLFGLHEATVGWLGAAYKSCSAFMRRLLDDWMLHTKLLSGAFVSKLMDVACLPQYCQGGALLDYVCNSYIPMPFDVLMGKA